jgi:hypothetical protein
MQLKLFVPGTPKNSNSSRQWARMATARDRKKFRTLAADLAGALAWPGPVPDFVRVTARQISNVNRRRDPGGLAERLKPLLDGLVDSGLLEDDNEDRIELVLAHSQVIKGHEPGIELTLEPA